MAELTFKSAGVSTREIDLSSPSVSGPTGVPAGVIGTSELGPAFVPVTVANFTEFVSTFGPTDGESFGPLAVNEWLKNAQSLTYVRVLGAGDGKKRNSSSGKVTNAGFVVGAKQVQSNGLVGTNPYANTHGDRGNVHFLGCYMSESAGSTIFSEAGLQAQNRRAKVKIRIPGTDKPDNTDKIVIVDARGQTFILSASNAGVANRVAWQGNGVVKVNFDDTNTGAKIADRIRHGILTASANGLDVTVSNPPASDAPGVSFTVEQNCFGVGGSSIIHTKGLTIAEIRITGSYESISSSFDGGRGGAIPILRGVLYSASGVMPLLSGNYQTTAPGSGPASTAIGRLGHASLRGGLSGSMSLSNQDFVLFLNGHKGTGDYGRMISGSFDVNSPSYISRVLNTDPTLTEKAGHCLYSHYDIHSAMAVPTGSGVLIPGKTETISGAGGAGGADYNDCVFITTGTLSAVGQAGGSSTIPEYRSFEDRFTTAKSPYVISQNFGGRPYELFRVEARSDGDIVNTSFKISIENLAKSNSDVNKFGKFDLLVRDFFDTDDEKVVLESFRGLSMDPQSERYFARVVGDQKIYFDFDQSSDSQKLVVDGDFPNQSRYVRIKVGSAQKAGEVPDGALPMGFRGPSHLVTSGSDLLTGLASGSINFATWSEFVGTTSAYQDKSLTGSMKLTVEPPIPFRQHLNFGTGNKKRTSSQLFWGVQSSRKTDPDEPNKPDLFDMTIVNFTKYFPNFSLDNQKFSVGNNTGEADTTANGILDSDRFNNNIFTLERIKVRTGSDTKADPKEWVSSSYTREGGISIDRDNKTRAFSVDDLDLVGNRKYAKFTFFLQGGFNGTNVFNEDKSKLRDNAAKREMDDSTNQGGKEGSTIASFRRAIDIMANRSDVEIKLLAIPGMRDEAITDYAIDAVENRFDSMYIMDIEERDTLNNVVTSSVQNINVSDTVTAFKNRALDSSFAAAYFPDVVLQDPVRRTNVRCPPSVAVLGAFSLNDALGHPWFAPAGFSRGSLSSVVQASVDLNRANLDNLYDADINPITDFPGTGVVVWGQKTLLAAASALDRVNVRRLLIDIRRKVRAVANTLLFEPNRESTLEKFTSLVNPILQKIQEKSGLDRYKVIIDTTTTTQADIENNTIRGKIFVQPTRTAEFIALDFVVTNAGAEI